MLTRTENTKAIKKIINFPGVLEVIIFYNFNMIIRNYVYLTVKEDQAAFPSCSLVPNVLEYNENPSRMVI